MGAKASMVTSRVTVSLSPTAIEAPVRLTALPTTLGVPLEAVTEAPT